MNRRQRVKYQAHAGLRALFQKINVQKSFLHNELKKLGYSFHEEAAETLIAMYAYLLDGTESVNQEMVSALVPTCSVATYQKLHRLAGKELLYERPRENGQVFWSLHLDTQQMLTLLLPF